MTIPPPRPGILDIAPYIGGLSELPGIDKVIKLSSNESALGPSPLAREAYLDVADHLHRYPDSSASGLRNAISREYGIESEKIVCGNGSDELISLLVSAYAGPGDEVLYSRHGFLVYPIAAYAAGATPVEAPEKNLKTDIDAILNAVNEKTRVVLIANPNNPTGSYLTVDEMERLANGLSERTLLVIDAAYAEYVTAGDYTAGDVLAATRDNVVMTRTFSKIYGLSALRLGWAYGPAGIVDVLNRTRGPFNVSAAAQAAGIAAISDSAFTARARAYNETWRQWTADQLNGLGLTAHPSVANFLLVGFPLEPARCAAAADAFLKQNGIIVRRVDNYGLADCLRISIGAESEMRALLEALTRFMSAA